MKRSIRLHLILLLSGFASPVLTQGVQSNNTLYASSHESADGVATKTGGEWVLQSSGSNVNVDGLFFLDGSTGIGVGDETVFRTTDGGANWASISVAGGLFSVWFPDNEIGIAVGFGGNSGIILRSTDQGITWNQLAQPGANLFDIHFADALVGMAVGNKIIIHTTDGGATWETLVQGTVPPLEGVFMISQSTAVAVGGNPTLLRTSNGGVSWQTISTPATTELNGVGFLDSNIGVAVGALGTIIRTTDSGLTWSLQSSNTTKALNVIRFNSSGTEAIAVGQDGTILQSTDAGITWVSEQSPPGTDDLVSIASTADTGWTAGGIFGVILHRSSSFGSSSPVSVDISIDSLHMIIPAEGDTFSYQMTFTNLTAEAKVVDAWTKVLRPLGPPIDPLFGPVTLNLDPFEVLVIDTAQMGVPFDARSGEYSLIAFVGVYQSDTLDTDTTTFTKLPAVPCEDISGFQARCGPGGTIQARVLLTNRLHSGDRVEFTIDGVAYEVTITGRRAVLSVEGFAVGPHAVDLTEPPGCFEPLTVTCPAGQELPDDDWLSGEDGFSQQTIPSTTSLNGNYPNPFNPTTTVSYQLAEDAVVSLKVYNLLGQEVATLADGPMKAGYHQAVFDANNLASGLYFYRLTAGRFTEVKKMVVMR